MIGGKEPNDAATQRPCIPDAVLDQLLAGADPKTVFDPNGLLDDLKKALAVLDGARCGTEFDDRSLCPALPADTGRRGCDLGPHTNPDEAQHDRRSSGHI